MATWDEMSRYLGRNDLPAVLVQNWGDLDSDEDRAMGLCDAWRMAEWPERIADADLWLSLFDQVGFVHDGEAVDVEDVFPDDVLTLYRGATIDRRSGLSWTTEPEQARWFADRFGGLKNGLLAVWKIQVPRSYAVAKIDGRGESEVVVDTSGFAEDEYEIVEAMPSLIEEYRKIAEGDFADVG